MPAVNQQVSYATAASNAAKQMFSKAETATAKTQLLLYALRPDKIWTFDKSRGKNEELISWNRLVMLFRFIIIFFSLAIGTIVVLLLQKKESDEDKFNHGEIVVLSVCGWFCATTLIGFLSFHSRIK